MWAHTSFTSVSLTPTSTSSTAAQLATGLTNPTALTGQVTNPYFGQIPASSTIAGARPSPPHNFSRPIPNSKNVATYRNNSGTTNYNALEAKVEQRFSYGLYLLFGYTHSKLIDDASSVFSFDGSLLA